MTMMMLYVSIVFDIILFLCVNVFSFALLLMEEGAVLLLYIDG